MEKEAIISKLHLKFAKKTWKDTFQLVRRCMEKSRDKSKPCKQLVRCLERLQEEFDVSSMNTMRSRLEMIARQQQMGFHFTGATCYLTADLFYLEVLLLPCGGVEEVKVAPHGQSPVPSESLLQLLRCKCFADFSVKLGGLFAHYSIPGDNDIKLKLLASLQHLGKDLQQISQFPRPPAHCDPKMDIINNGSIGYLKEDDPLTIQFYVPPTDTMKTSDSQTTDLEAAVQAAHVTVGSSAVPHQLQMASLVPQPPQLDPQGHPMFAPLSEVPNEMLPACFLLRLQPAIPVMLSFVKKLNQITDVAVPDVDLQWAPLPKLLMGGSLSANSHWEKLDEQESIFTVPLPGGVMHSYILPGAAWNMPAHGGIVVDRVAFTHPAHVSALVDVLRHQCAINTLLRSCFSVRCSGPGLFCDLHFEVRPESDSSFSVTFQQPNVDSLAVLLVNVSSPHEITCTLFGRGTFDPSINEYISTVMKRCMSIPVTMNTLNSKLEEITSAPLSPRRPATTEAENDHSASSSAAATDTNRGSDTFSQGSAVPEDSFGVSASACFVLSAATSELPPEINTSPPVSPHPLTPAEGVSTFDEQDLI
ncbi:mediator of RNA polymerase II transcription subunit 1 [Amphiprion ocellaris]|uniref:Mediator of RNA polymerase II transcription subunit 1 n=1 Tax=Amphiprion ocellaris TaxID=80972 RepID=A0A3Q1BRR8_AMPOC|nr:mediator of RNA polymerase II transcription subunit 1 [Amphiprion ocellaris]